jgi:hypothetical protein
MAGPLLVVELPEATASPQQEAALIEACSAALHSGRCELPQESEEQKAAAIAVISFPTADRLRALVEVGRHFEDREVWLSEELAFRPNDASIEQYRSIGLTVAVMFHELSSPGVHRSQSPPPKTNRGQEVKPNASADLPRESTRRTPGDERDASLRTPRAPPMNQPAQPRAWLALGGLAGTDFGTRAARFGAGGSLGYAPIHPLVVGVSGHYLRARIRGVDLSFASVGVGVGGSLSLAPAWSLRAQVEVLTEDTAAEAHDPQLNLNTRRDLWVAGVGGALELIWSPGGWWGVVATLAPERLARAAAVTVHDQPVGTTSPMSWAAGVGLEFHPFRR